MNNQYSVLPCFLGEAVTKWTKLSLENNLPNNSHVHYLANFTKTGLFSWKAMLTYRKYNMEKLLLDFYNVFTFQRLEYIYKLQGLKYTYGNIIPYSG